MRWNAPLSECHAELLLDRLAVDRDSVLVDLGCGWGELLLRAVSGSGGPPARATGVDTDETLLARARTLASARGVSEHVEFLQLDAAAWTGPANRLICIGASHVWGGTEGALSALAARTEPGGRLLFGDGYWQAEPSPRAQAIFGGLSSLEAVVGYASALGWRVLHHSSADQREWDEFESDWRRGREEWLLANPAAEQAQALREELDERRHEYLSSYRGVLGFCYLVLARHVGRTAGGATSGSY